MTERKDRIRVHIDGQAYSVVGGAFQEMLAAVKQINGRRFVSGLKVWELPGRAAEIKSQLDILGYRLEGGTPIDTGQTPLAQSGASGTRTTRQSSAPSSDRGGDRIRLSIRGHACAVVGGEFQAMLAAVKNLPGRRFDGNAKVWELPGEVEIIRDLLEAAGFQLEGAENIPPSPSSQGHETVPPAGPPESIPAYESPDFSGPIDVPDYEPPDWWDDDNAPLPPMEAPDWWDEEPEESYLPPEPPDFLDKVQPPSSSSTGASGNDQIRVRLGDQALTVSGGSFQAMLAVVKNIPGRRFNGQDKVWELPAETDFDSVQQVVKAAGFILQSE